MYNNPDLLKPRLIMVLGKLISSLERRADHIGYVMKQCIFDIASLIANDIVA